MSFPLPKQNVEEATEDVIQPIIMGAVVLNNA